MGRAGRGCPDQGRRACSGKHVRRRTGRCRRPRALGGLTRSSDGARRPHAQRAAGGSRPEELLAPAGGAARRPRCSRKVVTQPEAPGRPPGPSPGASLGPLTASPFLGDFLRPASRLRGSISKPSGHLLSPPGLPQPPLAHHQPYHTTTATPSPKSCFFTVHLSGATEILVPPPSRTGTA